MRFSGVPFGGSGPGRGPDGAVLLPAPWNSRWRNLFVEWGVVAAGQVQPPPTDALVVFGLVALAFLAFVTEPLPIDVSAILLIVLLAVLEPWTGISSAESVSGFASEATITVLAMFVLSEGIRRTGTVQLLSRRIVAFAGGDERKQLASMIGVSGLASGFINNTPVVAVLIPVATDIADRTRTSPSKLLLPVSFASMFGGMLTLIGTSTNLLASDVSARLIGEPFSMFEFTRLGAVVLVTAAVYLLVVGRHLVPARIPPNEDLTEEYGMGPYLTEVAVGPAAPLVDQRVGSAAALAAVEVLEVVRDGEPVAAVDPRIRAGDRLVVTATGEAAADLSELRGVDVLPDANVGDADLATRQADRDVLAEVVLTPRTGTAGRTLAELAFGAEFDVSVLALRRGETVVHEQIEDLRLRGGDTLLVRGDEASIRRLREHRHYIVAQEIARPSYRTERIPIALGIVGAVVALAALNVLSILTGALAGVVAMVATGCVRPGELYDAVDWSVIFLLAGVIPLGVALEQSGGAAYLASLVVAGAGDYPPIVVLGLFYFVTTLMTEIVSNNASVVLMIPVGVDVASRIGADPFAFVLAVTFAASTSVLTPIGYQTNLMVYGPGGYRFSDYFRVGAPLQAIMVIVTTLGIAFFWGV